MQGRCSECGLDYAWCDIFNDRLVGPRWSFEHGPRMSIRRLFGTLWRVALVPGPWKTLRIELAIVLSRLLLLPVGAVLLVHFVLATIAIVDHWEQNAWRMGDLTGMAFDSALLAVFPYVAVMGQSLDEVGAGFIMGLAWFLLQWALMPLLMLILGETFQRVRVRRIHLLRGVCYSSAGLALGFGACMAKLFWDMRFGWGPSMLLAVALLLINVWFALWWYSFVRGYLRLPRAAVVVGVLMFVNLLATFTIMLVVTLALP